MKSKDCNDLYAVSGLNNLGNTCFFNSVLQNLSQTPHLQELIEANAASQNKQLHIKHDSDYDSELTDYEPEEGDPKKKPKKPANGNVGVQKLSDDSDDESESSNESPDNESRTHRSIRLPEMELILKEPQGPLTKQLGAVLKNMTSNFTVVNPTTLFGILGKRVPQFKGYQQQDSHELLRNLLDCVRMEELRRRQAAILEVFNLPSPQNQTNRTMKPNYLNSLDDLTKKRLRRYNRLASHTFIDQIFGGHLLSSVVCSKCNYAMQRVESFLDLSLPINTTRTDNLKTAFTNQLPQLNPGRILRSTAKRITRKDLVATLKKDTVGKEAALKSEQKPQLEDFYTNDGEGDEGDEKLSKHQTKKQIKMALKKAKKGKKNSIKEEEQEQEQKKKPGEDVKENKQENVVVCQPPEEVEQKIESLNDADVNGEDPNIDNQKEVLPVLENNSRVVNDVFSKDLSESLNKLNLCPSNVSHPIEESDAKQQYKLKNDRRLNAMESLGDRKLLEDSTDLFSCTLQSCLLKFTSRENLNDKIECENCTKNENAQRRHLSSSSAKNVYTLAVKQYLICDLPANLTIHLKRFMQHGYKLEKNNKLVEFPLELDMSPFVSNMCRNSQGKAMYTLNGIVEHSGRLNSGHYMAYVKQGSSFKTNECEKFLGSKRFCHLNKILENCKDLQSRPNTSEKSKSETNGANGTSESSDRWFYISDAHVTEVNVSRVLKAQAYILFYQRIQ